MKTQSTESIYDVAVIGGGVVGCAVARELAKYDCKVTVLEKEEDVCSGTSKANSGIIHAGFDAEPGTWKAKYNVLGNAMMDELAAELDFEFRRNGSLVLSFSEEDRPALLELYQRGIANGVQGLQILNGDEVRAKEPNIGAEVVAALFAPTGGIVCPFGMTIAFAENAAENGVEFRFDSEVLRIARTVSCGNLELVKSTCVDNQSYEITTNRGVIKAQFVVNAAGLYSDIFHNMVSAKKICINPRRGEYLLLDKGAGGEVSSTVFQLPGKYGKGVLVTPTVHGNLLVGPTASDQEAKDNFETTAAGMAEVKAKAVRSVRTIPFSQVITTFAGLRAHETDGEFILGEPEDAPGFFDAAGIESPGLTCAPAIGKYLAELVAEKGRYKRKNTFRATRKAIRKVMELPVEEREILIKEHPEYGVIVCRCENISEGEMIEAIRRPLGAKSLDGLKRRVRQGMGRCQAGFCMPRAVEILAREMGVPEEDICKNRKGSEIIIGEA